MINLQLLRTDLVVHDSNLRTREGKTGLMSKKHSVNSPV